MRSEGEILRHFTSSDPRLLDINNLRWHPAYMAAQESERGLRLESLNLYGSQCIRRILHLLDQIHDLVRLKGRPRDHIIWGVLISVVNLLSAALVSGFNSRHLNAARH